jgi:hypothetical protein
MSDMTRSIFGAIVAWTMLAPLPAAAQGWITVSEPARWSDGRTVTVSEGTRIRVAGQAFHRSGVDSIYVDGVAATVRRGANNIANFTASITATRGAREVLVLVKPRQGSAVRRQFPLAVTGNGPALSGRPAPATPAVMSRSGKSPNAVFVRGLLAPGLGQMATGRKPLGAVLLAGGVGALGYGVLSTRDDVNCATGADPCPPQQTISIKTVRPHLALGIGTYVVLTVASAFEAKRYAARHPERIGMNVDFLPYATVTGDGAVAVDLMRVSF